MNYSSQCGSCLNFKDLQDDGLLYDNSNPDYIKGHCVWYGALYYPTDSCNHYDGRRDESGGTCYITTIVCEKLGLADDCFELQTLRGFRENYLQRDAKYIPILFEYDMVGPLIARSLRGEDCDIIQKIFDFFIVPIVQRIIQKSPEDAISKYTQMTNMLKKHYGISYDGVISEYYDSKSGGHGYYKVKRDFSFGSSN